MRGPRLLLKAANPMPREEKWPPPPTTHCLLLLPLTTTMKEREQVFPFDVADGNV